MLNELTQLASKKSSDKRFELMNAVTDMFLENERDRTPSELDLFGDVFTRLLNDMDDEGKVKISTKFAHVNDTPKTFAMALIYQDANVAAPMLEFSGVLDDTDLVNAAKLTSTEHRVAIAKRIAVSTVVTDTLISYGETTVLHTIGQNVTANISNNGFKFMVKSSPDDGELLAILLQRDDLPKDIKTLLPHLGGGVLPKVARVADAHSKNQMQDLIDRSHEEREAKQKTDNMDIVSKLDIVNQVRANEMSFEQAIIRLATNMQDEDLAQLISEYENIDLAFVKKALTKNNGELISILCRAIGVSEDGFKGICTMREKLLTLPLLTKTKTMNYFKDLDIDMAKEKIRRYKLGAYIAQKQQ